MAATTVSTAATTERALEVDTAEAAVAGSLRHVERLVGSDHHHPGADLDATVEIDDVLVAHADAPEETWVPIVQGSFG
jgi:hypothetical protein